MNGFDPKRLRAHRESEAEEGFPLLRGCAGTGAIRLLAYLDDLTEGERRGFADQMSNLEERQAEAPLAAHEELLALVRGYPLVAGFLGPRIGLSPPEPAAVDLRFMPVKVLAKLLQEAGADGVEGLSETLRLSDDPRARAPAAAHAASLAEIEPVEPRRLRKLLDEAMARRFGATAQPLGKDHVRYEARGSDAWLRVDLMFAPPGRILQQFDYQFSAQRDGRPKVAMQSYEGVWRIPARWDMVTRANAERSVAHVAALVAACLELA
jgi:hypothetical protein